MFAILAKKGQKNMCPDPNFGPANDKYAIETLF